jgi:hypothetical protein
MFADFDFFLSNGDGIPDLTRDHQDKSVPSSGGEQLKLTFERYFFRASQVLFQLLLLRKEITQYTSIIYFPESHLETLEETG